ncbi:DUF192 domain-containing protein [Patescibacteria group bacterium]|nr:DUF192 domain-containing protein [Patescibacteria group bacterium]
MSCRKIFALIFFLILVFMITGCVKTEFINLKINNHQLKVEVVNDLIAMAQGLSDRESLGENHGMLFVYEDAAVRSFWMKNMKFPLDIIWIRDNQVIEISTNIPLLTNGQITQVTSKEAVDKVLEVNVGWAENHNIKIGDVVE